MAKSLEGDYRPEHLFALRQSLVGYRFYQTLISEVDQELEVNGESFHAPRERPSRCRRGPRHGIYQRAGNEPALT